MATVASLRAEIVRLRHALASEEVRRMQAEGQRDYARALCTWEYFGRTFPEPQIDAADDDGWTYRVRERVGNRRVHIVQDGPPEAWEM